MRRWTHPAPMRRQSSQPSTASGSSVIWMWSRWVQAAIGTSALVEGQGDAEGGGAGPGVDRQGAVVAVDDDPPRGREAQARALAGVLRREELVEDVLADLRRDAGAVVGDLDDRAAPLPARGR